MSPKRGERVAPPAAGDLWEIRFGTAEAAKGWAQLCQQAASNTLRAWETMRTDPAPTPPTSRHHALKGSLATGLHRGQSLPQWQIEVTGAGRIWYLIESATRTVWLIAARTGHPKATE